MPQTREHFDICRLLRVPVGLVALTKSDLVDADTLEVARLEVRELVAGSFLEGAPIVPVSARTGDGLDSFRATLVDVSRRAGDRAVQSVARLPIDRVFSMKGFGTVVTGTLVSGRIRIDDDVIAAPGGPRVKVRGVQVHGQRQDEVLAGRRAAVNLAGVEVGDLHRGQALVTPDAFDDTRLADAVVEVIAGARPLKHGARVRFHQGTAEILGRVALIGPFPGKEIPAIAPGSRAFVRLRLETPTVLARGDRYILRAYSPPVTIAGGLILDPRPPRTAIRSRAALERARALLFDPAVDDRAAAEQRAAAVMIGDAGQAALPLAALISRVGVDPQSRDTRADALVAAGQAVRAGDVLVSPAIYTRLKDAIAAALTAHHRTQPLSEGIPREELREQLFGHGHPAVFERALADLGAAGAIAARERVALASHRVELSPEEDRARTAIELAYRDAGLKPSDAAAIAAEAGIAPAVADRVMKLLQRQKVLVRVDVLVFHEDALRRLKTEIAGMKASAGGAARLDVAAFKERFGVSRKFAIPLLEYLDRERVTRRMGDTRVVL
jgi:selenocysteine-specific elongation factor